jgi:hypothetical protein
MTNHDDPVFRVISASLHSWLDYYGRMHGKMSKAEEVLGSKAFTAGVAAAAVMLHQGMPLSELCRLLIPHYEELPQQTWPYPVPPTTPLS